MTRFHVLTTLAGVMTFSSIVGAASDSLMTETIKVLPLTLAEEAAQAAIASCKAQGYNVSVAVVDRAGNIKVLLAGDGTNVLARDLSRRKAYTAALRRTTTIELAAAIAAPGAFNPTLYDTQMVTAGGGVPIKVGDEVIGGIGAGGAPGGDKDEACAKAGIAKIADHLK